MKRGGRSAREGEALRTALAAMVSPCPFGDDCTAVITWSAEHQMHRVTVFHKCPARVKTVLRRDCTDFLITVLRWHGALIGDYNEELVVRQFEPGVPWRGKRG